MRWPCVVPFLPRDSIMPSLAVEPTFREGQEVTLFYGRGDDRFQPVSRVVGQFGRQGVLLSMPRTFLPSRGRFGARRELPEGEWSFRCRRAGRRYPLIDISTGGIGLGCDPVLPVPQPGSVMVGVLEAPGLEPVPIRVMALRRLERRPNSRYAKVGARFEAVGRSALAAVAGAAFDAMDLVREVKER
jgi:hypothetical protein